MSGLSPIQIKQIMNSLAHPHEDMFLAAEIVVYECVYQLYMDFSYTQEFILLPSKIRTTIYEKRIETERKKAAEKVIKNEQLKRREAARVPTNFCSCFPPQHRHTHLRKKNLKSFSTSVISTTVKTSKILPPIK